MLDGHRQRAVATGRRSRHIPDQIAVALKHAAGWILQHPHVIECALARIELGILPDRAQRIASRPTDLAGVGVYPCVIIRIASYRIDLLERRSGVRIQPSLDDLDLLERGPGVLHAPGVLERSHYEGWRPRVLRPCRQVAPHRTAQLVPQLDQIVPAAQLLGKAPATEESQLRSRSAGGIGFAAPHGVEQRIAAIFLGPDGDQSTGGIVRSSLGL